MNKMKGFVVVAAVFVLAACGGSGSSTDTGGSTTAPAATSAKTYNAMSNVMDFNMNAMNSIMSSVGGMPAAQVVKVLKATATKSVSVNCTGTMDSYNCTASDGLGGTCIVTGSATEADPLFTFHMTFDCNNFKPDTYASVDGSYTADMTMNADNVDSSYMAMTAKAEDGIAKVDSSSDGTCDISDDDTSFGESDICSVGGAGCIETASFMAFNFTVGADGLTIVDECGTYTWGPSTAWDAFMCMPDANTLDTSFDINGMFNDSSVNESLDITCDVSSVS